MAARQALLAHLALKPEGLTFTEIQRFVAESNGLDFDAKIVVNAWEVNEGKAPKYARKLRGYWCDNLCSATVYRKREGILEKFCTKVGNRYVLK